jgi:hypothetical protein
MRAGTDRDAGANLLERRWFSAIAAARVAQADCEVQRGVMEFAETAWRRACMHLAELEAIRDSLGEELAALDDSEPAAPPLTTRAVRRAMSAA